MPCGRLSFEGKELKNFQGSRTSKNKGCGRVRLLGFAAAYLPTVRGLLKNKFARWRLEGKRSTRRPKSDRKGRLEREKGDCVRIGLTRLKRSWKKAFGQGFGI